KTPAALLPKLVQLRANHVERPGTSVQAVEAIDAFRLGYCRIPRQLVRIVKLRQAKHGQRFAIFTNARLIFGFVRQWITQAPPPDGGPVATTAALDPAP